MFFCVCVWAMPEIVNTCKRDGIYGFPFWVIFIQCKNILKVLKGQANIRVLILKPFIVSEQNFRGKESFVLSVFVEK